MPTTQYVIIKKDRTPLMFSDNVVLVYNTLSSAKADFDVMYDYTIVTLDEYKNNRAYVQYNKFSVEL